MGSMVLVQSQASRITMSNKSKSNTGGAFGKGPKRHRQPKRKPSLPGARLKRRNESKQD